MWVMVIVLGVSCFIPSMSSQACVFSTHKLSQIALATLSVTLMYDDVHFPSDAVAFYLE